MPNALIALQLLEATLQVAQRIQAMLAAAQAENRDVNDDELAALKTENDKLEIEILKD